MAAPEPQPPVADDPERHLPRWLSFVARLQAQRPWLLVIIAALSLVPAALSAMRLDLKLDLSELLPDTKESVVTMRRVSKRLAGSGTLSIIVRTPKPGHQQALDQAFLAEDLVVEIGAQAVERGERGASD